MIKPEVAEYRLKRARFAIGKVKAYKLGKGGFNPWASLPGESCDCSGYIAWVLHTTRTPTFWRPYWFETTKIYERSVKPGIWSVLQRPEPGCIAVYPDKRGKQGHMAVVSKYEFGKVLKIIDCSASYDGVVERHTSIFDRFATRYLCLRSDLE